MTNHSAPTHILKGNGKFMGYEHKLIGISLKTKVGSSYNIYLRDILDFIHRVPKGKRVAKIAISQNRLLNEVTKSLHLSHPEGDIPGIKIDFHNITWDEESMGKSFIMEIYEYSKKDLFTETE